MKIRFLEIAWEELEDVVGYYRGQAQDLEISFMQEIAAALKLIMDFPDAWQPFHVGTRRCLLRRFPYGIIYKRFNDEILILAVVHLHRLPDYWIDRLPQ